MDVPTLLKMTKPALDELWSDTKAGEPPLGVTKGTAIVLPGLILNRALARHIRLFAWQGKTFEVGRLTNRINGHDILAAQIYKGPSIYDGEECIVLDYAVTPLVERLRDEIRQIDQRLYLGRAYRNEKPLIFFALESVDPNAPSAHVTATLSSSPTK